MNTRISVVLLGVSLNLFAQTTGVRITMQGENNGASPTIEVIRASAADLDAHVGINPNTHEFPQDEVGVRINFASYQAQTTFNPTPPTSADPSYWYKISLLPQLTGRGSLNITQRGATPGIVQSYFTNLAIWAGSRNATTLHVFVPSMDSVTNIPVYKALLRTLATNWRILQDHNIKVVVYYQRTSDLERAVEMVSLNDIDTTVTVEKNVPIQTRKAGAQQIATEEAEEVSPNNTDQGQVDATGTDGSGVKEKSVAPPAEKTVPRVRKTRSVEPVPSAPQPERRGPGRPRKEAPKVAAENPPAQATVTKSAAPNKKPATTPPQPTKPDALQFVPESYISANQKYPEKLDFVVAHIEQTYAALESAIKPDSRFNRAFNALATQLGYTSGSDRTTFRILCLTKAMDANMIKNPQFAFLGGLRSEYEEMLKKQNPDYKQIMNRTWSDLMIKAEAEYSRANSFERRYEKTKHDPKP